MVVGSSYWLETACHLSKLCSPRGCSSFRKWSRFGDNRWRWRWRGHRNYSTRNIVHKITTENTYRHRAADKIPECMFRRRLRFFEEPASGYLYFALSSSYLRIVYHRLGSRSDRHSRGNNCWRCNGDNCRMGNVKDLSVEWCRC